MTITDLAVETIVFKSLKASVISPQSDENNGRAAPITIEHNEPITI